MGRLHMKATNFQYKEYHRRLKEQIRNSPDDENIITEIFKELTAMKDTSEVGRKKVLMWTQRAEVLDNIRNAKEFDSVRRGRQNNNNNRNN